MRKDSGTRAGGPSSRYTPSFKLLAWTALAGTLLLADALRDDPPPPGSQVRSEAARTPVRAAAPERPALAPLPASDPLRIRIPAIGVDAHLMRLALDEAGALEPPPVNLPAFAGWYADGTAPGSRGTAVVTGHLDTPAGPAVFHDLGALERGAEIAIARADGRTALFTVEAVEDHAKSRFPDDKVYGESGRPELRLITCGGGWSDRTGYQANTVVYASLTAVR
ncbi:class F sortase [Streptomyces sp. NPDC002057]|uniref:class F sortase n=1 Tax=Streptomyces sp. NPDC002057 TaxID=3154664 RepID=UPI003327A1FC